MGFLLGLTLMGGMRVRSFWKRLLLLLPALVVLAVSGALVRPSGADLSYYLGSYLTGFVGGVCLLAAGYTRSRQSVAKP